jgi:hypothetical protein
MCNEAPHFEADDIPRMELESEAMAITFASRGVVRVVTAVAALALIAAFPTAAHAKKQKKLQMDPTVPEPAVPAGPVPPEADANGHVNYGNPTAEGLGRVTVKAKTSDKVQVYLEGRYFGDAPITIYSVPKGDYIVEGTIQPSGKQVSSPVSVSENEEASVELGAGKIETPAAGSGGGAFSGEISPRRLLLTKVFIAAAGVGLISAVAFGILENSAENDYEKAAPGNQANLDSIMSRGKRDATLTDVGLLLMGVGVGGAIIAGYPMVVKSSAEKAPDASATTAFVAPLLAPGLAGGAFAMRF